MARGRTPMLVGLLVVLVMGIAVYLRLWTIDYTVSSVDTELLRRQFDIANREAMDESAEWRMKFDEEMERANNCARDLKKVKDSLEQVKDVDGINKKLALLQKENAVLLEQVKVLNQQLEALKLECRS